ncbi:aspartate-semialdehyde dehydrogenase [Marinobacterium aestuarii]|uniref:Aspartate-semialdehyde dehydrogenase n=2 Tax=Marinobacterium aestuarii TaxID=1821621 RepID=A0A1A9EU38_9GAMM|nr:aspartate-semialdehyde dehydrogenase [Marinobacterium aestuarii]
MNTLIPLNSQLLGAIRGEQFAGYDPFDSLNSTLLQATPFGRSELVRLAWLQLGKRSPINLRPLLRVPKKRNPKGVGLFILGLLEDHRRTGEQQYLNEAKELGDWLLTQRSPREQWQHSCWGYHFDWQARAFYVPAGKPNIITTCYVARALYALGEATAEQGYIEVALDAAHFIVNSLYTEADGRCFYAYIPGETAFVHNASLWGAAWVGFAGARLNDPAMCEQALDVARQSVSEQGADGSWVYGARHHHQFIDGFHTGYNLEALCLLRDALDSGEFDEAIKQGYRYYVNHFFTEDGTAKYYNNNVYPLDMHSVAQAVFTLLKVGGSAADEELCAKVIARALEQLYMPGKKQFVYQKSRWLTNRINYARWTQAWAYYALAFYNRYRAENQDEKN